MDSNRHQIVINKNRAMGAPMGAWRRCWRFDGRRSTVPRK
jgi:hypothetical protein